MWLRPWLRRGESKGCHHKSGPCRVLLTNQVQIVHLQLDPGLLCSHEALRLVCKCKAGIGTLAGEWLLGVCGPYITPPSYAGT